MIVDSPLANLVYEFNLFDSNVTPQVQSLIVSFWSLESPFGHWRVLLVVQVYLSLLSGPILPMTHAEGGLHWPR